MTARRTLAATLLGSTILSALPMMSMAQQADTSDTEVIVTAQKRSERLQSVPLSIQAISTKKLDQLNVSNFNDYALMLPSVSFQTLQPGSVNVYMRGVASGGDGNHSGSLPSVGVYLDEQPVTTIGGAVDVHIYDIARIESLAGPQGTLYGASSEAGTLRIITNKPDQSGTYGRFDVELNKVDNGGTGYSVEGMFNVPLSDRAALRLVGWAQHDAGYIDNVAGTRTFLAETGGPGITVNNAALVKKDFNDNDTIGARAALKIDLNDSWTVTGSLIAQDQKSNGVFGYDPRVGDLKVQHFYADDAKDNFYQAAATVTGNIANLDVTYAVAHMERNIQSHSDYSDYAEAYDALYFDAGYIGGIAQYLYITDAAGNDIDPRQRIEGKSKYKKTSHELRFSTPADSKLRFVGGVFYQDQTHDIHQDYQIPGLAPAMSVNGHAGTVWLTEQVREDKDTAVFGEVSYDFTPTITMTAGLRAFEYENTLIGFFGFGRDIANGPPWNAVGSSRTGVAGCYTTTGQILRDNPTGTLLPGAVAGTPCTNLGVFANGTVTPKIAKGHGTTPKINMTWKPNSDAMFYATYSKGFRPGGINRRADVVAYKSDFLSNVEIGYKGSLDGGKLHVNAALYRQKWTDFQFSFLGANSFTEIHNGPDATINGFESDFTYVPNRNLTFNGSFAYTDAKTDKNLCAVDDPTYTCSGANRIDAPSGTRLPITPKVKFSGSMRYKWDWENYAPYWQVAVNHQSDAISALRTAEATTLKAFTLVDLAFGGEVHGWTAEMFVKNVTDERAPLTRSVQCGQCYQRPYYYPSQPRTMGIRLGSKF